MFTQPNQHMYMKNKTQLLLNHAKPRFRYTEQTSTLIRPVFLLTPTDNFFDDNVECRKPLPRSVQITQRSALILMVSCQRLA